MITYRMQDKDRDLADLMDPEQQFSFPMNGDDEAVRHGVSGMDSLPELAAYLSVMAIEATTPVLVRIEGPESDDEPCDAWMGERLTLPETAELVDEETTYQFLVLVGDLIDWQAETGNFGIENFFRIRAHADDIWNA
jgi:hypothetical protein